MIYRSSWLVEVQFLRKSTSHITIIAVVLMTVSNITTGRFFGEIGLSTNHDDLYIIWNWIFRDSESEVRNLKFHRVTSYIVISVCFSHILGGNWNYTKSWCIYISSEPDFHRDSESEVRNSKISSVTSYIVIKYLCVLAFYFGKLTIPIMMIYISSEPDFHRDSESEVRNSKFHLWHHI